MDKTIGIASLRWGMIAGDLRKRSFERWPDLDTAAAVDPELILRGAQELASTLGLGALPELPEQRDWAIHGAKVSLTNQDGFRFELSRR